MTTGKPQQMAADNNSSDDLIAELSKLMAQDAHVSRQDVKPAQIVTPSTDTAARPNGAAAPSTDSQVTPFSVRIPGAAPTPAVEQPVNSAPVPRFDFGRPAEPVATIPRQEPSFAPAPGAAAPVAPSTDEPAPFNFDFSFGQPAQQAVPEPQPVVAPAPAPTPAPVAAESHDTIADLISAELLGDLTTPITPAPAPVPVQQAAPAPVQQPAPVESAPVAPVAAAPAPAPANAGEPAKLASWAPKSVAPNLADRPTQSRPTMRPVNLTPLPRADHPAVDSFRIPPVFGLGVTPPPAANVAPAPVAPTPQPAPAPVVAKPRAEHGYLSPVPVEPTMAPPANDQDGERDPIDEIESLIGRAVRVELDNAREQQPVRPVAAAPVVPRPVAPPVASADETIMAAAAATGAEIGWVSNETDSTSMRADEPRRGRERAPRRAGMFRSVAGPLVAVALLLAAGFGLYSVLGLGGSDGPAPVLVADTAPIKQVPEAKGPVEQLQQSIVFNEMDGVVPGAEEQLVSRDQADVNEVTAIPPTAAAVTDEGLANRKVRTVTVRPDGSIVSGEDSVAGAAILPVDRPNVPAVPGAETASSSLLASANATSATPTATPAAAPVAAEPVAAAPVAAAPAEPLVPGTEIAVVDPAGAPVSGKTAPVPYVRPASVGDAPATGPVNAVVDTPQANLEQPAGSLPQAAPTNNLVAASNAQPAAAAPVATGNSAPAYAQLSSQRSPEVAQQVAKDLSARYASLLNGAQLEITRADLGARGTYYRVRVPAASQQGAAQFCASVVASGGDCLAM
jgi:hypothetical protein